MPERYLSEVLQSFPGIAHHTAPLIGIEAQMYNRLWRSIIDGKLKPGTKLREDIIGETFEVSRTVVRKVLGIMEQEGIVALPVNRGAYVATPTPEESRDAYEAIRMITSHVVEQLAAPDRKLNPIDINRLQRHMALQIAAEESGDFALSKLFSSEFYVLLVHIHGNSIFGVQIGSLVPRLVMATMLYRASAHYPERSAFQRKLVCQIVRHDQAGAVATIRERLRAVERSLNFEGGDEDIDLRAILAMEPVTTRPAPLSKKYGKRKQEE